MNNVLKLTTGRSTGCRLLLAICGLAVLAACVEEPTPPPPPLVPTIRVADADGMLTKPFPGRAGAGQRVNMSFRVTGPLIDFPVNVGDEVEVGQTLAQIDPKDYITALGTVQGQLDRARAAAERAEADYRRISNVFREDPGATSETALDLAKAARDSSRATVSSLSSAVTTAEDQLSYATLQAPFSGVVVATYVENYETVIAKQPILRLLDDSSIEFVINVPENLIIFAPYVENISVVFDALPGQEIPARVKEIGREASQSTRTYPVTLVMEQPEDAAILPGMAGTASVTSILPEGAQQSGIEIPASAVFAANETAGSFVWVVDEQSSTLQRREVTVGRLGNRGVFIQSGLESGDLIVVRGVNSVSEGQQVRVVDFSAGGSSS